MYTELFRLEESSNINERVYAFSWICDCTIPMIHFIYKTIHSFAVIAVSNSGQK